MPFSQFVFLSLKSELSKYTSIQKFTVNFDDYDTIYRNEQDFIIEVTIYEQHYLADVLALGTVEHTVANIAGRYFATTIIKNYI